MSDRVDLRQELVAVLRAHGVAVRDLNNILRDLYSPYCQFSLQLDESMSDEFATLSQKVAYFAVFAHAPQASNQVTSKIDAWEWVKHHARMYTDAPPEASLDRRSVISGMAGASVRALIAMSGAKYALHWPLYLRSEFITLRQELSARRMHVFGWSHP